MITRVLTVLVECISRRFDHAVHGREHWLACVEQSLMAGRVHALAFVVDGFVGVDGAIGAAHVRWYQKRALFLIRLDVIVK